MDWRAEKTYIRGEVLLVIYLWVALHAVYANVNVDLAGGELFVLGYTFYIGHLGSKRRRSRLQEMIQAQSTAQERVS